MKRVMYVVVAALVGMVAVAPVAAAQGENLQQLQQAWGEAQERVQTAQQYMQSEQGQQALEDAKVKLQEAGVQLRQARESVQGKMQEVTSKMERTALVKSGGPGLGSVGALAAPAAALLVGGAILGYAVLRRR